MTSIKPRELWPEFRPEWIVFEDEHLLVVDKPISIACQAADAARADDLPSRLRRYLAQREASPLEEIYLGVHQRLDQETSGLLVYTKRREANAALARQFESRSVRKRYLACVERFIGARSGRGRSQRSAEIELRDSLLPRQRGVVRVAKPSDRLGRLAISRVRPLEREGERTLIEVQIETGRTHQIRVQLAHHGSPIVGDRLYGGSAHWRQLLHAASLAFDHPISGERLELTTPLPPSMRRWLDGADLYENADELDEALELAIARRWTLGSELEAESSHRTTAFRWVHGEADGLPGLAVDLYGDHLVLHLYDDALEPHLPRLIEQLTRRGARGIYLKRRPRQANIVSADEQLELAPEAPIAGEPAESELDVYENGRPHRVSLGDGFSTGLFLDQRDNRQRVFEHAEGRSVLNLFSYTCAFTMAAALGGASRTLSIDASGRALDRGRQALRRVGAADADNPLWRADVFESLGRLAKKGQRFDLIIADPPTYATTRRGRWKSGPDWKRLVAAIAAVSEEGATWLLCSNDRRMNRRAFRGYVQDALPETLGRRAHLRDLPPPIDFPTPPGEQPHMKSLWVELGA